MNDASMATYLTDHLAGSVTALELLEHLEERHRGTELERFFRGLRAEIGQDQDVLRELVALVGAGERPAKKAVAWLGEKVARLKLAAAGSESAALRLFESLEVLALGVWGKRAVWVTLAELAPSDPRLAGRDFESLRARAEDQFARLERRRLEVAPAVFGDGADE